MYFIKKLILIFLILYCTQVFSAEGNFSLDLQEANLSDTIRLMAKFLKMNVLVSSTVNGSITLHLHNTIPKKALDMVLASQGLAKWETDNLMYIAPQEELIKYKQEQIKWQEMSERAASLVTKVWTIHYGKAEEIAKLLQDEHASIISKRGRLSVDSRTNMLYLRDLPNYVKTVQQLITQLDVPVKQVLIETRIVSADSDFERELGINFAAPASNLKLFGQETRGYNLAVIKLTDGLLLDVKLAALENAGHARLISSPRLFTANQQTASIEAGEEIPYQEASDNGGTALAFKKAVLGLKVTPQVLPGNRVLLHMQINQDRPSSRMIQGVPAISTRQILTNVLIKNGKTIVLGGIYETDQENDQQSFPFISKIPFIGWFFGQTHVMENKRELLIFVTPKVIE